MSSADDEAIHLLVELYMSSKNYHSAHEVYACGAFFPDHKLSLSLCTVDFDLL